MTTKIAETVLGFDHRCYTDFFGVDHPECFGDELKVFSTRGINFPFYPDGFDASDALQNYSKDIPYNLDPEVQWRLGFDPPSPRDPYAILYSVVSGLIPEVEELENEPDYAKAMELADVVISKLRNTTYNGIPFIKLALWQLAVAEGMSAEELSLYGDISTFPEFLFGSCLFFSMVDMRNVALRKVPLVGTPELSTPIGNVKGVIRRIGMDNLVLGLLNKAQAKGVKIFYGHKVTGVYKVGNSADEMYVMLEDGSRVKTGTLFLNIPRSDLLSFGLSSEPMKSGTAEFKTVLQSVDKSQASKMYCYWEDAWWLTKLNFTRGVFRMADETLYQGRYHDGDVQCSDPGTLKNCRGSLLVSYASGSTTGAEPGTPLRAYNSDIYWPFGDNDALRKLIPGNMTSHEQQQFDDIHTQLRRVHKKTFELIGMDSDTAIPQSEGCVYADWREIGIHVIFGAPLDSSIVLNEVYTKPVAGLNLSLVNENWNEYDGWAEGSLLSAERALYQVHGLSKPWWMDEPFHKSMIRKLNVG